MKKDIHPNYHAIKVEMTDGTQFETRSTWGSKDEVLKLEIDPKSHSAWTGGNQKVLYDYALSNGADIIVLLHGDNQYDASMIPSMIEPILNNTADAVLGSRILGGKALEGGMPLYKYFANHLLNFIQNSVYQLKLSDYATGYKAYSNKLLTSIPYHLNRDDFIFDEQLNTQIIYFKFRLSQVGIPTRYFKEASSVNFFTSVYYGLWTLFLMLQFTLSKYKRYTPKFLSKTN